MILRNPYASHILKLTYTNSIENDIDKYIVMDYSYLLHSLPLKIKQFTGSNTSYTPVILAGLTTIERDIPPINHPLFNETNKWVVLDLRTVTKPSADSTTFEIRNEAEYKLLLQRFILTGMWASDKQSALYSYKLPHQIFATWISENLTKKFGLDLGAQVQLRTLAFIYYAHLFTDDFTKDDLDKLIIRLQGDILLPGIIEDTYLASGKMDNIDDFCAACYNVTKNIRLKNLDRNVLINIISNNWIGLNSKELVLLSLSHPPTWIALVYSALVQRTFSKSVIGSTAEKLNKKGAGDEFLKALIYQTKEYIQE